MPPRNSDAYSLLILDEHLWKWIDACNYNDSISSFPGKEDNVTLLKRVLSIWPVLLKLLNIAQSVVVPPEWLPYVIRAADRLMLCARDIPMKAIRSHIEDLLERVTEIESRALELIEIQVQKEKLVFMSNYSGVQSEYHTAVEYWPHWEPHVRDEAMSIIRSKLEEYQSIISSKRMDLEKMHIHQLSIRDRWSEMRGRLHPERYEDSSNWWGSMIRPKAIGEKTTNSISKEPANIAVAETGVPEYVSITEKRLRELRSSSLQDTIRALTQLYLNSVAAAGMVKTNNAVGPSVAADSASNGLVTSSIPWSILRAISLDLLKEFSHALEKQNGNGLFGDRRDNFVFPSSLMLAVINMVDIMLRVLYCYDMSQFDAEEREISEEILSTQKQIDLFNSGLSLVNPSNDPVVARFSADAKSECMQAALNKFMDAKKSQSGKQREQLVSRIIALEAQLSAVQSYKQTNYENPWNEVWRSWNLVIGETKVYSGINTPPEMFNNAGGSGVPLVAEEMKAPVVVPQPSIMVPNTVVAPSLGSTNFGSWMRDAFSGGTRLFTTEQLSS